MSRALLSLLLIYASLWISATGYLMQKISLCTFSDDKQGNITFYTVFTFNHVVVLSYSKEYAVYLSCPNWCIPEMKNVVLPFATLLNSNPDTVTRVNKEEEQCKENVKTFWNKTVERRVKPSIEVFSPVQKHPGSLPVLVCYVWGFYPADINVAWFKNDILVKNFTEVARTGEWTYQIVVTLDLRGSYPEDNYTCMVKHSSLTTVITKNWKHGLTNIQIIKISVASVVFALGLVCLITGIACWRKAKRSGYSPIPGYNDFN